MAARETDGKAALMSSTSSTLFSQCSVDVRNPCTSTSAAPFTPQHSCCGAR